MLSIKSVGLQAGILLLFVPGIVLGGWQECPANITVYTGCCCYTTVSALYTTNDSSDCTTTGYKYYVYIRPSSELNNINDYKPFGDITVTVVDNSNSTTCNITTTGLVNKSPGLYDLMLQFVPNPIPNNPIPNNPLENQECHDKLFVEETIPSPTITGSKVTCEGIHLEWEGPVLASGFTVLGYTLTVLGPSFIYELKTDTITSQLIPYSAGLEWCTVSVAAIYCGGTGNSTNETLYAAIVEPVMKVVNVEDPVVFYKNATSCSLFFEFEIDCEVSHPKSATIITNCTSSVTRHRWNSTTPPHPVSIRHDGSIIVDSTVPLNHQCDVRIIFNNGDLSTSIDRSVNTDELDPCSFITNGSALAFLCVFSQFSSLKGCKVQLTLLADTDTVCPHTMSNYTINVTSDQPHGVIDGLCNGLYLAQCFGLAMIDPSSSTEDSHSLVYYDPEYTTTVAVTAEVTSYTTSNLVTVTFGVTSCTKTVPVATNLPSIESVTTNGRMLIVITVLCVLILLLLVVGLAIGFFLHTNRCNCCLRCIKKMHSNKKRLASTESTKDTTDHQISTTQQPLISGGGSALEEDDSPDGENHFYALSSQPASTGNQKEMNEIGQVVASNLQKDISRSQTESKSSSNKQSSVANDKSPTQDWTSGSVVEAGSSASKKDNPVSDSSQTNASNITDCKRSPPSESGNRLSNTGIDHQETAM